MDGFILGIFLWFIVSFTVLLNYGRSDKIGKTTNPEHLAILLVCLPATIVICIMSLGTEIIDFLRNQLR